MAPIEGRLYMIVSLLPLQSPLQYQVLSNNQRLNIRIIFHPSSQYLMNSKSIHLVQRPNSDPMAVERPPALCIQVSEVETNSNSACAKRNPAMGQSIQKPGEAQNSWYRK